MAKFIIRRLLQMIPLLLGVTFISFAIVNLLPGNPFTTLALNPRIKPGDIEMLERAYGLDKPWLERYVYWLGDLARGDLGISLSNRAPVLDRILNVLPNTILLSATSLILAILIAIPIGIFSATRRNTLFDHIATITSVAIYGIPTFWLGLLLIILFSVKFREWGLPSLPVGGMEDLRDGGGFWDRIEHMILPVFSLTIVQIAGWSRYVRGSMLETLQQDYIRTARAKGLENRVVIYGHAFRNALLPLVTLIGLSIPELVGGAFLIETLFAWNGIGRLAVDATTRNDFPVIMGVTLMFAFLTMIGNLVADVLYGLLDPRIALD
jgi:peptide/nickel transport system permease protein